MDTLEAIHAVTIGNRCFRPIYDNLEVQELLELEVSEVDSSVRRTTERLLLKLTALHRIFQLLFSKKTTCGKLNDVCYFLMSNNTIIKLVSCLEDTNHHVVFMATKAISSLMLAVPLISATRIQLEGLFHDLNGSQWKSLYVMCILKQVLESRAGDTDLYNARMQSGQMSSVCNCVSREPRVLANEEKKNIELLEFIMAQEWMSILPSYVPLWKEIFVRCIDEVTENQNCTAVDVLEYHSKLASSTHQTMRDGCFEISARSEKIFVSFLSFTAEFFHWTMRSCFNVDSAKYAVYVGERIFETLEFSKELMLLKIIQVMPHFLHVRELSSEVWKEILKLLSFSLNTNTCTLGSQHYQNQTSILHSSTAFICAVNCGILENLPVHTGVEGFGGSTVKPSRSKLVECCKTKVPKTGLFRQASLLVVQAALVLLNNCENYRNAQLSQEIFKAINIWHGSMIKVGTSNHDNKEAYQKEPSNHNNQEEYQREPCIILMDIFVDQDDEMIQIMLLLIQLFKVSSRKAVYQDATVILSTLNPHLIFQAFLKVVGFDHSVLLDFLISSETVFLDYLMQYLHFVLQDWQGFCQSNNNLVEDNITTGDEETGIRSSQKNCQLSHHSNVRTILKLPDIKSASMPAGNMTCNQSSPCDISSASSGLGGLLNICSAYGSDTEDDDRDDDGMRNSNSAQEDVKDVDVHEINVQNGIFSNDNTSHDYIYSGSKLERKHDCNTDNMGSDCNDNSDQGKEDDHFDVYNSVSRNEEMQDDNDGNNISMRFVSITHMNHGDYYKQRDCLAHDDGDDDGGGGGGGGGDDVHDHDYDADDDDDNGDNDGDNDDGNYDDDTDFHDNEEDVDVEDDHDKISGTISIHFQGAADSLSTMLEKTMSTLIHTRIAAERLNDGSLFPYQVKPLINVMKKVEKLYDGC